MQREHVLTMRYGKEQMQLVRKRMRVEEWLFNALEELFDDSVRFLFPTRVLSRAGQCLRTRPGHRQLIRSPRRR